MTTYSDGSKISLAKTDFDDFLTDHLTTDFWESVDTNPHRDQIFPKLPFMNDERYLNLPNTYQRYILAYSLKGLKGWSKPDCYRYASRRFDLLKENAGMHANKVENHPVTAEILEELRLHHLRLIAASASKVVEEEALIAFSDITDYIDDSGFITKEHLQSLPPHKRRAIKSIEVHYTKEGDPIYKLKLWDKGGALTRLAKIMDLNAPTRVNVSGDPKSPIRIHFSRKLEKLDNKQLDALLSITEKMSEKDKREAITVN